MANELNGGTALTDGFFSELALPELARFLRSILNSSRDGFWVIDRKGRMVEVNEAYVQLSGYSRKELLNMGVADLTTVEKPHETRAHMKRIIKEGSDLFETRHRLKDGRIIDIELSVTYLKMGAGYFICFCRDISSRKRQEAEHEHLLTAIKQMEEPLVVTDEKANIQYVNPAFEKITGYSHEEVLGKNPRILKSGQLGADFYKSMWETLTSGKTWSGRLQNKRKDGTLYTEDASISPVRDESGRTVSYVAVKRDMTRVMDMESQLKQAEKIQSVGVLAGGIAHDFNNILFPMIGFAELLMEDLKDDDYHRQKAEEILNGARRAANLVRQILAISSQARPERRPVPVLQLLKDVLVLARSAIPSNVVIENELAIEDDMLFIEPVHMHQMVMNLITNAFQTIEPNKTGSIRLSASKQTVESSSLILKDGNYLVVEVTESGGGISPEIIEHIFEPVFTAKAMTAGSGLGLSIARGLAREYGGEVTAENRAGTGAVFTLFLPLMEQTDEPVTVEPEVRPVGRERILLVDDEATIVRMLTLILERYGYLVSGYSMAEDALAAFQADPDGFDLVICDMAMPLLTGLQLAQTIKAIRPDQLILICTGYSEQLDREQVLALGVSGLLVKPLLGKQLAAEVRRVLDEDVRNRIRGRILVIDDEAPVRHLFQEKLSGPNCQVIEAANGLEGLDICRREKPDLVITDLIMPEKEGIETIMELHRVFPDLPIIAISGGGRSTHPEPYLSLAQRLGARQVFAKPISWQPFLRVLAELLSRKG